MWKEVVEKSVDIKAKISLQPLSETKQIGLRCEKDYMPTKKDESNKNNRDHWDRDKNKSIKNLTTANVNQP